MLFTFGKKVQKIQPLDKDSCQKCETSKHQSPKKKRLNCACGNNIKNASGWTCRNDGITNLCFDLNLNKGIKPLTLILSFLQNT